MKVNINKTEFYMDGYLKQNLDELKKAVKKKWDGVFLIDGMEGSAKSTIGKMICYYLSEGQFNNSHIVFTPSQFYKAIEEAKPGDAILWDEFVMGGLSLDVLSEMQRALVKKFTLIRKKNLFVGLVIPYIFMLTKYFAISRTRFLIHTYSPDGIARGYFRFYNYPQKQFLYFKGKNYWNYPKDASHSFEGKFTDTTGLFIDENAYEQAKDEATKQVKDKSQEYKQKYYYSVYWIYKNVPSMTLKKVADIFNLTDKGVQYIVREVEKLNEGTNE